MVLDVECVETSPVDRGHRGPARRIACERPDGVERRARLHGIARRQPGVHHRHDERRRAELQPRRRLRAHALAAEQMQALVVVAGERLPLGVEDAAVMRRLPRHAAVQMRHARRERELDALRQVVEAAGARVDDARDQVGHDVTAQQVSTSSPPRATCTGVRGGPPASSRRVRSCRESRAR